METVKFLRKGFFYFVHKHLYRDDPGDTCTYKRQLIWCFIVTTLLFPVTILRNVIFFLTKKDDDVKGIKTFAWIGVLTYMAVLITAGLSEKTRFDFVYWSKLNVIETYLYLAVYAVVGAILIAVTLGIIVGISWLIYQLVMNVFSPIYFKIHDMLYKTNQETLEEEPATQLGVLYQSAKDKLCKKITWE